MENQIFNFFYVEREFLQIREQINEMDINMMYHKSQDNGIAFGTRISLKVFDTKIDVKIIFFKNNSIKIIFRNFRLILINYLTLSPS